jgi:chromosomal replication initiation ATPase DnaA
MNIKITIDEDCKPVENYTLNSLIKAVCDMFAVSKDDLIGMNRMAYIVTPRHVLYYMGYTYTPNTLPALGMKLKRDHTSVLYGVQKIRERKMKNKALAQKIEETHMLALAYEEQAQNGLDSIRDEVKDMIERIQMEKLRGL